MKRHFFTIWHFYHSKDLCSHIALTIHRLQQRLSLCNILFNASLLSKVTTNGLVQYVSRDILHSECVSVHTGGGELRGRFVRIARVIHFDELGPKLN